MLRYPLAIGERARTHSNCVHMKSAFAWHMRRAASANDIALDSNARACVLPLLARVANLELWQPFNSNLSNVSVRLWWYVIRDVWHYGWTCVRVPCVDVCGRV